MSEKQRILIVDDIPFNLKLLNNLLKDNYSVSVATDGNKAISPANSTNKPDLILLDIIMPEMDGYEVCKRLKLDPETDYIPIIFITVKDEIIDETLGFELGAVDYITKPTIPPILLARVKNHLLLKSQQDQLKKSISIIKHESEMLQQKAELGIQAGSLAHDMNNILSNCSF